MDSRLKTAGMTIHVALFLKTAKPLLSESQKKNSDFFDGSTRNKNARGQSFSACVFDPCAARRASVFSVTENPS
jgi:hypothetical protein